MFKVSLENVSVWQSNLLKKKAGVRQYLFSRFNDFRKIEKAYALYAE